MVAALSVPFARAMVHGDRPFVIGVLGDSTAAGADNCYYDAWPRQLERLLAPLVAAAGGLKLEVRNTARRAIRGDVAAYDFFLARASRMHARALPQQPCGTGFSCSAYF